MPELRIGAYNTRGSRSSGAITKYLRLDRIEDIHDNHLSRRAVGAKVAACEELNER